MTEYLQSGLFLQECRKKVGLTQAEVSKKLGVHSQFVSNWERGCCLPPGKSLKDLYRLYKISPQQLAEALLEDSKEKIYIKLGVKSRGKTKAKVG